MRRRCWGQHRSPARSNSQQRLRLPNERVLPVNQRGLGNCLGFSQVTAEEATRLGLFGLACAEFCVCVSLEYPIGVRLQSNCLTEMFLCAVPRTRFCIKVCRLVRQRSPCQAYCSTVGVEVECNSLAAVTKFSVVLEGVLEQSMSARYRIKNNSQNEVTGVFCTSGSEREFTLEGSWYADEEIQVGPAGAVVLRASV